MSVASMSTALMRSSLRLFVITAYCTAEPQPQE